MVENYKRHFKGNVTLGEIAEKIKEAKSIVLTAHISPDGDALGSILAFYFMIEAFSKKENLKKKVSIVIDDELPKYMKHFEERELIKNYDEFKVEGMSDLFISLDCANQERYGKSVEIKKLCKESINIDHHVSNTEHADFNYVEDICSMGELVHQFIEIFGIELSKKMAEFMYLGIINDTGNFRHDNVTEHTFEVCADLMRAGANNHKIANIIFAMSVEKMNLFGDVYKNSVVDFEKGFIYYYLSQKQIKEFNLKKGETDGVAEIMLKIDGMELSLFAREEVDGTIKGSLRCNDKYNVNEIASIFNGGGHVKAAGFKTDLPFEEILKKISEKL